MTNTTTIGAYRGAGRPEATQLIERVIDVAARKIDMDPAEFRRKNYLKPESFPLTTTTGANYDSGEYAKALDAVLDGIRLPSAARRAGTAPRDRRPPPARHRRELVRRGHRARRPARRVRRGRGPRRRHRQPLRRHQRPRPGPPHRLRHAGQRGARHPAWTRSPSSTPTRPPCREGPGTMGSRSLQTAGSAVFVASNEVLDKAKRLAGHLLEADPGDIVVGDGGLQVAGVPAEGRVLGRAGRRRPRIRPASPRAWRPGRSATSSTSTAPTRPSRSARTSPSSRSTPRPGRSRCSATSPSTTAGASSTRSSSPASSTAASPRAPRRRCSSGCSTTTTATR